MFGFLVDGGIIFNGNAGAFVAICDRIIPCAITGISCIARFDWCCWSASIHNSSDRRCSNAKFAQSAYMFQSYRFAAIRNATTSLRQTNASRGRNMRFCCRIVCNHKIMLNFFLRTNPKYFCIDNFLLRLFKELYFNFA